MIPRFSLTRKFAIHALIVSAIIIVRAAIVFPHPGDSCQQVLSYGGEKMSTALILLSDFQKTEIELWRPIVGHAGFEVSSLGRIRTFWRNSFRKGTVGSLGRVIGTSPRILRQHDKGNGYLSISLPCDRGKYRWHYTHRFVAPAFIPNPKHKPEVNHKTAYRFDPRMGNLEWVTRQGNVDHAISNGLVAGPQGSKCKLSKLIEADVADVRERLNAGESHLSVADIYTVHKRTIKDIDRRKTWKHVA
jgi:hypothetical protein